MLKLVFVAATALGLYTAARWWRQHPRVGTELMNRTVNPWLQRRGFIYGSHGELALIQHVGRKSGTVRLTPIHPMPIADGFRIIVPVGAQSEWARNVLAAGHCTLTIADRRYELDHPVLETPADVPDLARPVRALFGWLGFRYLRLRTVSTADLGAAVPPVQIGPAERDTVAA